MTSRPAKCPRLGINAGRQLNEPLPELLTSQASVVSSKNGLVEIGQNQNLNRSQPENVRIIRIGSRKSILAVKQAEHVLSLLQLVYGCDANGVQASENEQSPAFRFELVTMSTKGDQIMDVPLAQIGSKALFTKELETALLSHDIDLIVHSCKDLPTTLPPGCRISAILSRENPNDVLVLKKGTEHKFKNERDFMQALTRHNKEQEEANSEQELTVNNKAEQHTSSLHTNGNDMNRKRKLVIGTSSLRRIAQLRNMQPDCAIADIRGNIDTRLRKLDSPQSDYAALVLAAAGLIRANFGHRISASLRDDWWHAVGQGALAVECRENDEFIQNLLYPLIHFRTTYEIIAERSFMQYLEGGCSVPLGVKCWFGKQDNQSTYYAVDCMRNMDEKSETGLDVATISTPAKEVVTRKNGCPDGVSYSKSAASATTMEAGQGLEKEAESTAEVGIVIDASNDDTASVSSQQSSSSSSSNPPSKLSDDEESFLAKGKEIKQKEFCVNDEFDCNDISNLTLSSIVYSIDGSRHAGFSASLKDALLHMQDYDEAKINCTHIQLPTRACPRLAQVKRDFIACAKLGIYVAQQVNELGAREILAELRSIRQQK